MKKIHFIAIALAVGGLTRANADINWKSNLRSNVSVIRENTASWTDSQLCSFIGATNNLASLFSVAKRCTTESVSQEARDNCIRVTYALNEIVKSTEILNGFCGLGSNLGHQGDRKFMTDALGSVDFALDQLNDAKL